MALRRKRDMFKALVLEFFSSKDEIHYVPDGPQRHARSGGFFNNAQQFTLHNPTMTSIHGNQYNTFTNAQGDRNIVTQIMNLLSQHIIRGTAHDSSARTPPPRCHPDTRVKLIARITAWFEGQTSLELLLWITGPAGVGKSAVVQTFAEYLAKSKLLGASVFISRPSQRNNPHGIFVTIAYQLATRIEAYRNYIVERLSLDPELLNGDVQAQFMTFIVEPFVEKKIGDGGKRWGILLDGLDELRGEDAQCEIIQLISTFAHEHRDAPLIWIIASRPESHISNMFEDDEVRRSCWSEYIPIDSTEACQDVDRFLRSSFTTTRKKFRHSVRSDWPSDTDFLKLTAAASGLFVYAQVVMQFIGNSDHADPVSQLEILLSVIDRSNAISTKENPFVHLDALYNEVLSSIPSKLWSTAKQLLALSIYGDRVFTAWYGDRSCLLTQNFRTLRGMSLLFGITRNVIYASLDKCRSTLKVLDWKVSHKERLTFHHASFADYLSDSSRSGDFYVGNFQDVQKDVFLRLLVLWNKCSGDDTVTIESSWRQYCSNLDEKSPSRAITKLYANVLHDFISSLEPVVCHILDGLMEPPIYAQLRHVHLRKLCYFFGPGHLMNFVWYLMKMLSKPNDTGFVSEVQIKDLELGQLDWKEMSPACAPYTRKDGKPSKGSDGSLYRPRSSAELKSFVSELESLKECSPELKILICGGVPNGRVAVFLRPMKEKCNNNYDFMHYVVPCPY